MRDSHTLTRFSGVNTIDSPANVKPHYALAANNVLGGASGDLWQARIPRLILDLGPSDSGRITSLGLLDATATSGLPPRLVVQQSRSLSYADSPDYAALTSYTGTDAYPAVPGRLDYAQVNSVLYFSSGAMSGKVLPGEAFTRAWGIPQSPAPALIASTTFLGSVTIQRAAGVTTVTFANPHLSFVTSPVYVDVDPTLTWDPSFAGLFPIASTPGPNVATYAQPGLPDAGPFTRAVYPSGLTAPTGYQYRGVWGDGSGGWGTASEPGPITGPLTQQSPVLLSPLPPDPLYVEYALFRNLDDGGDWFLVDTYPVQPVGAPFAGRAVMLDTTTDDSLANSGQTPPYDNGISPNARFLCPHLDRILATGIPGDPKAVRYTGFDSINFGRAQDTWPRYNRLTVGEGQVTPNGLGITRYGPVIFGDNKSMFIVRGSLQDITTSAVTSLSFRVDELPFQVGSYSHFAIQSTSLGIVFLADDFNLQVFDGYNAPMVIAPVLKSVLSRITPGSMDVIASEYLSYLDREWYILSIPVDGALLPNLTIVLDISSDNVRSSGAWVCDYSIDFIKSVLNSDKTRHLILAQSQPDPVQAIGADSAGVLSELTTQFAPGQPTMPRAHWRSGYIGIADEDGVDEWAYYKVFRFQRFMTAAQFNLDAYLVDGADYTFESPLYKRFAELDSIFSINEKCRALSIDILFPDAGSGDPISGVTFNWNFAGKR